MLVESEFEVAAPLEQVWKHMQDVPRIAPCLPGAELIDVNGDVYKGRVTTKMGPVKLQFLGTAKIVQRDESAKRIVMDASGSEEKGKGQATMKVTSTMAGSGSGTRVKVAQDIQLSGAAAQFGRGMVQDVTSVIMKSFATCIADDIGRSSRGEAAVKRDAVPVKGFSIAMQATMTALNGSSVNFSAEQADQAGSVPVARSPCRWSEVQSGEEELDRLCGRVEICPDCAVTSTDISADDDGPNAVGSVGVTWR